MANNDFFDYSTAAGSVTDVGGTDITGATGKLKDGDNTIRELAAQSKRYISDAAAVNTVGGTGDAVTLTTARTIAALATGLMLRFIAGAANTTAATLTVNALAAKAIRKISGGTDVALAAGDLAAGETYTVIYRASANSAAGGWVIVGAAIANNPGGFATTATAAGTTTLTVSSARTQEFTGSTTQTVVLPVVSTFAAAGAGTFTIINVSTGTLTVNSSGSNLVVTIPPLTTAIVTNALITGTTAASWDVIGPIGAVSTGTFAPAFVSTDATFSYASQFGSYVKIGRLVTVFVRVALNTSGNTLTANALNISGLPFTPSGNGTDIYFPITWFASTTSYIQMTGAMADGIASIAVRGLTAAATSSNLTNLNSNAALHATNGSVLWASFSYMAAN